MYTQDKQEKFGRRNYLGTTNSVFYHKQNNLMVYFIPAYIRLNIKNISSMKLKQLTGIVNSGLLFSFCYQNLPSRYLQIIEDNIMLSFHCSGGIILRQTKENQDTKRSDYTNQQGKVQCFIKKIHDKDNKIITYIVRKFIDTVINPKIFWSPFQLIQHIISITVHSINFRQGQYYTKFKFNLMDCQQKNAKILSQVQNYGSYQQAPSLLRAQYSLSPKRNYLKKQDVTKFKSYKILSQVNNRDYDLLAMETETKIKNYQEKPSISLGSLQNFQYAHFTICMYKHPIQSIITIFIPLWMLSILNIAIYFQDQTLGDRFLNLAAIMIAYVFFTETLRNQLPPYKHLLFVEYLIYLLVLASFLCWIESIRVRNDSQVFDRFTNDWPSNGYLMTSIIISLLTVIIILTGILIHYCLLLPSYFRDYQTHQIQFDHTKWANVECDLYFEHNLFNTAGFK